MNSTYEKSITLSKHISNAIGTNEYEAVILRIIDSIKASNVDISSCDCFPESKTDSEIGKSPHIRLKLNKKFRKPEHVIWDILHEFGHGLSSAVEKVNITREIEAWDRAYKEFLKYPELIELEQCFFEYQKDCLETYYFKEIYVKFRDFCSKDNNS